MLKCSTCKETKPEYRFPMDSSKKRGYSYKCLECQREYAKKFNYEPTSDPITCSACHTEKDASNFGLNKRKPLGRNKICKDCHNERLRKQRQKRLKGKEAMDYLKQVVDGSN